LFRTTKHINIINNALGSKMNIYEIISKDDVKSIFLDKELIAFSIEESKKLKHHKIVEGKIHWGKEYLTETINPLNRGGILRKIPGAPGWFGVEYNNGEVGTYDTRAKADRARNTYTQRWDRRNNSGATTPKPNLGSTGGDSNIEAYKRVTTARIRRRAATRADRQRIRSIVASTKYGWVGGAIRKLIVVIGAGRILEEFLVDVYSIIKEIIEDPLNADLRQQLIDTIKYEGARVFGQILTFFAAAMLVARTARLVVSVLLNVIRGGSLLTGPIGAAAIIILTLAVEGAMWYFISTDRVQRKLRDIWIWTLQNLFPSLMRTAASVLGQEIDVDGDGLTEPFLNELEQATRDMVDTFGGMTAAEAEEFKDETEAYVAANAREIDPNAAPEDQPAPLAVRPAAGRALALPDQSISQQMGTLDW
jgi:hypothetical protein